MHARVTTFQVLPGEMDEAIATFRDSVLPAAREQPGFRGALGLIDRKNDKAIAITLWETEADLTASESTGYYREQVTKVAGLLAEQPTREIYEVGLQA